MPSYIPGPGGSRVSFNITTPTVVKTGPGIVFRIFVINDPTADGSVNDVATTGGAAVSNQICAIPINNMGGATSPYVIDVIAPFYTGLVINPGTGGVVSVSYE